MPSGPSLYRRHRPRTFADVVGQEHVVRTLRNAVEQGRIHHAYLFVGSRGTGKTSMAKILASCLNCTGAPSRPTIEPCGRCESCVAIASATSLDVVEMDAASNNSVDDIRELREAVQFAPVSGGHKVYILDEAHMLTAQAWNAFLKTLEEPPPNTIFVLATTEAHKVMDTVVDRCHRFDFTRPTVEQLAAVVGRVAGQEGIEIPPDAVALVARHATGSFRDALGTLEQLVTYSGHTIAIDDVLAVLGVADDDLLFGTVDAVAGSDPAAALRSVQRLADSGRDLGQFARDLEGHAREVLIVQTLREVPPQLRLTPERDARLVAQARNVRGEQVVRLLDLLGASMRLTKEGADARTQLELALVKAASPEIDGSARALLARVERLEAALAGGPPPPAPQSAPAPAVPPPAPAPAPAAAAPPPAHVAPPPPPPPAPAAVAEPAPAAPAPAPVALDLPTVTTLWPDVVAALKQRNGLMGSCYEEARPVDLAGELVTLAFAEHHAFLRRKAESPDYTRSLGDVFTELVGSRPRFAFEVRRLEELDPEKARPLTEDEFLTRVMTEFDAEEVVPDPAEEEPQA